VSTPPDDDLREQVETLYGASRDPASSCLCKGGLYIYLVFLNGIKKRPDAMTGSGLSRP